jgi:hypothetical protein
VELPRLAALLAAALFAFPGAAAAATLSTATTDPNAPVLVSDQGKPPAGYRLNARQVERIAARDPRVRDELSRHRQTNVYEYTKGPGRWQVSWFSKGSNQRELMQVYVDDGTGKVTEVWTGFQVAWTMARGYPGAFGRRVNALYVWLPMCAAFLLPFIPWRRRRRRGPDGIAPPPEPGRMWSLLHLDLLMLLGFSISLALFDNSQVGLSTPLIYPFLLYLLVRLVLLALGRGRPRQPLRLLVPASWLAVALVFLIGFRVGLNVTNSNVIDVGYAGVIGANKLLHGKPIYGGWPSDNGAGDTYGPVNYYTYVPFRLAFGWSGSWDDLPAAHAAAIAFDLLTMLGLFLLGRRVRGPTLGIVFAYAWAAYPFTLWSLESNANDTLVSALVVLALLVVSSAPARGVAAALAGLSKFAPLALGPLFLRGIGDRFPPRRAVLGYVLAYAVTALVVMGPVLDGNWHAFWQDTFHYQSTRSTPFSIWGLWGGLRLEQRFVEGMVVAFAIAVAFVPSRRTVVEVAALGGAVLIALQLSLNYWLYSYIVWFFPLVAVALFGSFPAAGGREPAPPVAAEPAGVAV